MTRLWQFNLAHGNASRHVFLSSHIYTTTTTQLPISVRVHETTLVAHIASGPFFSWTDSDSPAVTDLDGLMILSWPPLSSVAFFHPLLHPSIGRTSDSHCTTRTLFTLLCGSACSHNRWAGQVGRPDQMLISLCTKQCPWKLEFGSFLLASPSRRMARYV